MKKKIVVLMLCLTVAGGIVGCGNKNKEDQPKEVAEEVVVDEKKDEKKEIKENESGNIEIRIPIDMISLETDGSDIDIEQVKKEAFNKVDGVIDVYIDEESRDLVYEMTKEAQKETLEQMKVTINSYMESIVAEAMFPAIKDLKTNDDFTEFEVTVVKDQFEQEGSFDSMGVMSLALQSAFYQMFEGTSLEDCSVVMKLKDTDTGEVYRELLFPDAFEEFGLI